MSILEVRYNLATEIGLAVSIISLVITFITAFIAIKKKNFVAHLCTVIITALIVGLLLVNQDDMKNYINVPPVEGMSVEFEIHDLITAGFNEEDIRVSNGDATITDFTARVENRVIDGTIVPKGTPIIVPNGTQIILECKSDTYIGSYGENTVIIGVENSPSIDNLSIIIEDYETFTDGFHYEIPNSNSFVDFDRGISGHFSYSRELTEQEYKNWGHGGKILDTNGKETNIDASFFSTSDGVFAVEFPEHMPKGDYLYLLYQFINDEYYEARISFTIN